MLLKNPIKLLATISLFVSIIGLGCATTTSSAPLPTMPLATRTLKTEINLTADFIETASLSRIANSPTPLVTNTPTSVPPGVFVLLFYPPLIMNYDTSIWEMIDVNFIQVVGLETCQLGEIGPSGNFPTPAETLRLGNARYQVAVSENAPVGLITALYIEDQSLKGYNYGIGLAVLMLQSKPSDWNECKTFGEKVLSTLRVP